MKRVRELLSRAVGRQLLCCDVTMGMLLSGGLDSRFAPMKYYPGLSYRSSGVLAIAREIGLEHRISTAYSLWIEEEESTPFVPKMMLHTRDSEYAKKCEVRYGLV